MNLTTQIAPLKLIEDGEVNFSIRKWIADDSNAESWLFIISMADQIDVLRPLISTMTDIALNALLSLETNQERRLWFIIDEVAKLNKLPALSSSLAESRKYGGGAS